MAHMLFCMVEYEPAINLVGMFRVHLYEHHLLPYYRIFLSGATAAPTRTSLAILVAMSKVMNAGSTKNGT